MRMRAVLLTLAAAGCSFRTNALDDAARAPDGRLLVDASRDGAVDARPAKPYFYGVSASSLYKIDPAAHTTTFVGTITDGSDNFDCDGLAGDDAMLLAIPQSHDRVLALDPTTGAVTANTPLSATHGYWGFTMGPGPTWYLATNGSGETGNAGGLYTVDPASGTVTRVGAFGDGMTVEGDIAYVPGHGLYASLIGGSCSPLCVATVSSTTGAATVLDSQAASSLHALSGNGGALLAFDGGGQGWSVDLASGATTTAFTTSGTDWYDAAP
jgi:hypothetical protein